jgi:hypothetical protein
VTTAAGKAHYSFDTSALIDGIERYYPIANFPGLWQKVDELIDDGRLLVSEEAWNEAVSVAADLQTWCNAAGRIKCVYRTDATVATLAGQIVYQFPNWTKQGTKNSADPFVIAVGELNGFTVISGEVGGGPSNPKIPYVCAQRNVTHGRFVDMVKNEGWVFG